MRQNKVFFGNYMIIYKLSFDGVKFTFVLCASAYDDPGSHL